MNATTDPRRNSEGYLDLTAFEALKRAERRRFGYRPLVYICSPCSGDVTANIAVAREFCRVAVERRRIPFAPHLLFPQFMNDHNPGERQLAMFFNRILHAHCEAIGELQRVGVIPRVRPPWITSLHDLATIASVCDRPGEFLLYLRRRTDSGVTAHYWAADELDLYMLFRSGGLYVEPDSDQARFENSSAPPVNRRNRRKFAQKAVGTLVGDHCSELDAWMQRHQIEEHNPQPTKPTFNVASQLMPLIDVLTQQRPQGWLRSTADLLRLAGETQTRIAKTIIELGRMIRRDGRYHEVLLSFAGLWGHPTLFVATRPRNAELATVRERLLKYMRAKRYRLRSDRALGLLFDEQVNLEQVVYLNSPHVDSADLDALIEAMQLQPIGDITPPPIPSPPRRPTKRLRGKNGKRSKR